MIMSIKRSTSIVSILGRIIKAAVIVFFLVLSTTYGWRPSFPSGSNAAIDQGLPKRLENTVRVLSEEIGPRNYASYANLNKAADFIKSTFQEIGYKPEEWAYEVDGRTYRNIVVGAKRNFTGEYIVVGAHYDSCFNPGADDNASGIAGLLELARLLKRSDLKVPVMFVAFTNEEQPFFMTGQMGSLVFVRALKESSVKIKAAIILEMIGYYSRGLFSQKYLPLLGPFYPNKADFVAIVGNFASREVVDFIDNDFKRHKYFPARALSSPGFVPGINFSDHWSFWQEGYPAVMITDTAYLRNKNYHTMTDAAATLNYEKMAKVVLGLKEAVVRLSNNANLTAVRSER